MKREFQIRSKLLDGGVFDTEECICFTSLAEANEHYNEMLVNAPETIQLELIEVLRQDSVIAITPPQETFN